MHLEFTKEVLLVSSNKGLGNLENSKTYKVFKDGLMLGYFYYTRAESYFAYENRKFRVESKRNYIRKSKHIIVDTHTNNQIGGYKISEWVHGLTPIGDLVVEDRIYTCKRHSSLANNYERLSVENNDARVIYMFKINMPRMTINDKTDREFQGTIESSNEDLFLVFAGLFLLEHSFEIDDSY
jgi:hypothetical protein